MGQATVRPDLGSRRDDLHRPGNATCPPFLPLSRFAIGNKVHVGGGVPQGDQRLIGV